MACPKTSLWQPAPYPPSQLFLPIPPVHRTDIPVLDMHVTVSLTVTTIPLPSSWLLQGNYPSPSQQKTAQLIGPVSDNVLLSASSNLSCINYSSPNYIGLTNSAPSFCSTWVLWKAQIIGPIQESSFSVGPMHIHVSCWTPLNLASWSSCPRV